MLLSYDHLVKKLFCCETDILLGQIKIHLKLYLLALTVFGTSKFYRHGVKFISYKLNNKLILICLEPYIYSIYRV